MHIFLRVGVGSLDDNIHTVVKERMVFFRRSTKSAWRRRSTLDALEAPLPGASSRLAATQAPPFGKWLPGRRGPRGLTLQSCTIILPLLVCYCYWTSRVSIIPWSFVLFFFIFAFLFFMTKKDYFVHSWSWRGQKEIGEGILLSHCKLTCWIILRNVVWCSSNQRELMIKAPPFGKVDHIQRPKRSKYSSG